MQIPWWGQQTEWRLAWEISTLHYDTGNDITTALTDTVMLRYLLARFKDRDPGVTSSVRERCVRIPNTGQQGGEMAMMRGQKDIFTATEMYQQRGWTRCTRPWGP